MTIYEIAQGLHDLRWEITTGENVSFEVLATQLEDWEAELVQFAGCPNMTRAGMKRS